MKFLCDQCKAKYQISDEKVAGKTVRMKCRKCGHMIEVRAAVTETSVSIDMRSDDVAGAPPITVPSAAGGPPKKPALPQKPGQIGGPPRPGGGLATSLSSARPPAASRISTAPPRPEGGALAGAFQRNVQREHKEEEPSALDLLELSVTEEWYVAINGVPVGPVRVSELRRKAASGAVTDESLVWQEGLEEWRPVRAIPELAALVREAAAGGRVSLATPAPPDARYGSSPPGPLGPPRAPQPRQQSMPGPMQQQPPRPMAPAPSARNNVVPFTARSGVHGSPAGLATAERLEDAEIIATGPAAPPQPVSVAVSDPFAMPPPSHAPVAGPLPGGASPSLYGAASGFAPVVPQAPAKKPPPWIAIAMVVLAAAFGITAAIALFFRQPLPPAPVVIQMPTAAVVPQVPTQAADIPPPSDSAVAATGVDAGSKAGAIAMHAGGTAKPGPTATGPKAADLGSLLGSGTGPAPGGPGSNPGGGGGSSLTSDQVEATVRNHSAGVKRTCWEKIGDGKAGSVNVNVTANVAGNGNVSSATATGNDPVIAKCIEGAVRTWTFPATGGTTTVNIPFTFVRQ